MYRLGQDRPNPSASQNRGRPLIADPVGYIGMFWRAAAGSLILVAGRKAKTTELIQLRTPIL
jgi:hypothetical protein